MRPVKCTFTALLLLCGLQTAAQHSIRKIWETDSILAIPESVLPQPEGLYVSLINGPAWGADGQGGVARLSRQGRIIDTTWITGLNAPKGLARRGDRLYVADLGELVVINIPQGKIDHKLPLPGASGLNDVTVAGNGTVYVTDSQTGQVFKVEKEVATVYAENLKGVNGIKAVGDQLYILTGDGMYKAGADKKLTKICALEHGGDGIEPVGNGDFLVTAWEGWLYYVDAAGHKTILLDTHT
ncbi:MAG TPA: ATP-binding protein, partial [Chitinophaga sp.]